MVYEDRSMELRGGRVQRMKDLETRKIIRTDFFFLECKLTNHLVPVVSCTPNTIIYDKTEKESQLLLLSPTNLPTCKINVFPNPSR